VGRGFASPPTHPSGYAVVWRALVVKTLPAPPATMRGNPPVSASVTSPSPNRTRSRIPAIGLIVVAVVCAALAIFWLAVKSTFLASHYGTQPKHALVAGVVAVLALIAASIVWRQHPRA